MSQGNEDSKAPVLFSRRTVIKMGAIVGASEFLGSTPVFGGRQMMAYADEGGNTYFVVVVVAPDEAVVLAYDASQGLTAVLQGMDFTLTSYNVEGATVSGTTDEYGLAIVNIKALCPEKTPTDDSFYAFTGDISAKKSGYRDYATGFVLVHGGITQGNSSEGNRPSVELPTQRYDASSGEAYLRVATWQGNDIQYDTVEVQMYADYVQQDYTIAFEVACASGADISCKVVLSDSGSQFYESDTKKASAEGGVYKVSFTDKWVSKCTDHVGAQAAVQVYKGSNLQFTCDLHLSFVSPELQASAYTGCYESEDGQYSLSSIGNFNKTSSLKGEYDESYQMPFKPWLTSFGLPINLPFMKAKICSTPQGNIMVTATFNLCSFQYGTNTGYELEGKTIKDYWSQGLGKSLKEDWNKKWDTAKEAWKNGNLPEKWRSAKSPKTGGAVSIDFGCTFALFLVFNTHSKSDYVLGEGGVTFEGSASVTVTGYFYIGPVPMSAGIRLGGSIGVTIQYDTLEYQPDAKSDKLAGSPTADLRIDGTVELSLFIALGIDGVACFGFKGWGKFGATQYLYLTDTPGQYQGKSNAHEVVTLQGGVNVYGQLLFFGFDVTIWSSPKCTVYDNWKKKNLQEPAESEFTDRVVTRQRYITDDDMAPAAGDSYALASIGSTGRISSIDTSGLFTDAMRTAFKAPSGLGFVDPYSSSADGGTYDLCRGPKLTEARLIANSTFCDTRYKSVQVGDCLYVASIVKQQVSLSSDAPYKLMRYELDLSGYGGDTGKGNLYLVPNALYNVASDCAAGKATAEAAATLQSSYNTELGIFATVSSDEKLARLNAGTLSLGENPFTYPAESGILPVARFVMPVKQQEKDSNDATAFNARAASLYDMITGVSDVSWLADQIKSGYLKLVEGENRAVTRTRVQLTCYNAATLDQVGDSQTLEFEIPSSSATTQRANIDDVDFEMTADRKNNSILFGITSLIRSQLRHPTPEDNVIQTFSNAVVYDTATQSIKCVYCNVMDIMQTDHDYEWRAVPVPISNRSYGDFALVAAGKTDGDKCFNIHIFPKDSSQYLAQTAQVDTYTLTPTGKNSITYKGNFTAFTDPRTNIDDSEALVVVWQYGDDANRTERYDETTNRALSGERAAVWAFNVSDKNVLSDPGRIAANSPHVLEGAQKLTAAKTSGSLLFLNPHTDDSEGAYDLQIASFDGDATNFGITTMGVTQSPDFMIGKDGSYLFVQSSMEGEETVPEESVKLAQVSDSVFSKNRSPFTSEPLSKSQLAQVNPNETREVKQFQTLCCRWDPLYKRYRQFFPYAQMEMNPFQAQALCSNSWTNFIVTTLKSSSANSTEQLADVYSVPVQNLKQLTIEVAYCTDGYANKGQSTTVHPVVTVANTGNLPVRGFTVYFQENGNQFSSCTVDHLEERVVKSESPRDQAEYIAQKANDELTARMAALAASNGSWAADDDAILWPGSTRQYVVDCVTPSSWDSGEHEVGVTCGDYLEPEFDDGSCLIEGESFASAVTFSQQAPVSFTVSPLNGDNGINAVTGTANNYTYPNGKGGDDGNGGSGSNGGKGSVVNTGDHFGPLMTVAALAGTAAATVAAAKKRADQIRDEAEGEA